MRATALIALALLAIASVAFIVWCYAGVPERAPVDEARRRGTAPEAALLPSEVAPGWKLDGEVRQYDMITLTERINGAAPVYVQAGYVRSWYAEYEMPGRENPVLVDVFDMGTPQNARALYEREKGSSTPDTDIGDAGHQEPGSVSFRLGRHYVKMVSFDVPEGTDIALTRLARSLAAALAVERSGGK